MMYFIIFSKMIPLITILSDSTYTKNSGLTGHKLCPVRSYCHWLYRLSIENVLIIKAFDEIATSLSVLAMTEINKTN